MNGYGAPERQGLYDPANEHDACGVGFVANIKGKKSHAIVQQGLQILRNLTHRGAVGADPIAGVRTMRLTRFTDDRGYFLEIFRAGGNGAAGGALAAFFEGATVAQMNYSAVDAADHVNQFHNYVNLRDAYEWLEAAELGFYECVYRKNEMGIFVAVK